MCEFFVTHVIKLKFHRHSDPSLHHHKSYSSQNKLTYKLSFLYWFLTTQRPKQPGTEVCQVYSLNRKIVYAVWTRNFSAVKPFFDAYARCVLQYSIDSFTDSSNSSNVSVRARLANQISLKSFHQRSISEFSQEWPGWDILWIQFRLTKKSLKVIEQYAHLNTSIAKIAVSVTEIL